MTESRVSAGIVPAQTSCHCTHCTLHYKSVTLGLLQAPMLPQCMPSIPLYCNLPALGRDLAHTIITQPLSDTYVVILHVCGCLHGVRVYPIIPMAHLVCST